MFDVSSLAPYFQVNQNVYTLTQVDPVRIATADTSRVYISFARFDTNPTYIYLPNRIKQVPPTWIVTQAAPLELWWQRHGPLCQQELWATVQSDPDSHGVLVTTIRWLPPDEATQ